VISFLYGRKIDEVYTIAGKDIHSFEDHATILLRCGTNLSGMVETNWLTPNKIRKLTVIGLKGVAYLDYIKQTVEIEDDAWLRTAKVEQREPLKVELEHFIKAVSNGHEMISNGETSRHALAVAMAAIESYQKEKPSVSTFVMVLSPAYTFIYKSFFNKGIGSMTFLLSTITG
jgi:UDP-N-acetylglucosamine 3-dehydrogenase